MWPFKIDAGGKFVPIRETRENLHLGKITCYTLYTGLNKNCMKTAKDFCIRYTQVASYHDVLI